MPKISQCVGDGKYSAAGWKKDVGFLKKPSEITMHSEVPLWLSLSETLVERCVLPHIVAIKLFTAKPDMTTNAH